MLIVNEHTREIEIIVYNDVYDREQSEKKIFHNVMSQQINHRIHDFIDQFFVDSHILRQHDSSIFTEQQLEF
jgi:hypothetical protein